MKTAPWIIIVVLMGIIILMRECTPAPKCPECPPLSKCDTIKGDSIPYPVPVRVPVISYRDTGSTHWRYKDIDTAAILKAFFARNFIADTLVNDTSLFIAVYDTVSENRIIYRKPKIHYFPTIIQKTTFIPTPPVRKVFVGIGIGRNPNEFGLAPAALYISKKDNAYTAHYDFFNKDIYFTYFWKIRLKKR